MHANTAAQGPDDRRNRQPEFRGARPIAVDRLPQLGARARSFRAADLSDRRDRAGGDLPAALCRADRAVDRGFRRLRRVFAAGRLARRPLEPPQHDGGVLYRLRRLAGRRRGGAQSVRCSPSRCSRSACSPPSITRSACRCCWKPPRRKGARSRSTACAAIWARRSPPASPPRSPPGSAGARPSWCRRWCASPPASPMSCWCPTTATARRAARRPPTWCSRNARR